MKSSNKTFIAKLTELTFTLTNVNRATVHARGETPTAGWTDPELGNERVGDGIAHLDFLAEAPTDAAADVITAISTQRTFFLAGEPQEITVHSETNEMSVTLPSIGDPA